MKMHLYVKQLLEDLETAAANPPEPPCIEFMGDFEIDLWITELALAPFKPISEWTGIKTEVFPPSHLLTAIQMNKLFDAMMQVLDYDLIMEQDRPIERGSNEEDIACPF